MGPTMSLSVEDRLAIAELAQRYASLVDRRELDAAAALFTPDAELVLPAPPEMLDPVRASHGTAEIRDALEGVLRSDATVHEIVGQLIEPDPLGRGRALGRVRCVAHHLLNGHDRVWHVHYEDAYLRTVVGWRIARRTLRIDLITRGDAVHRRASDQV